MLKKRHRFHFSHRLQTTSGLCTFQTDISDKRRVLWSLLGFLFADFAGFLSSHFNMLALSGRSVCVCVWECPSQNALCRYTWVFPSNWFGFLSASSVILFNGSQSRRSLQMLRIRGQTNLVLHYCLWPSTPAVAAFPLSVSLHFNMSILAVTFLLLSVCWAKSPTIPGLHIPALAVASVGQGSPLPRRQSGEALTVCKRAD